MYILNYKEYNNHLYRYYIKIFNIFMKTIIKIETFVLIIFFIFSIYGYLHIYSDLYFNAYSFNELFINYQAGFVRRLLGEILANSYNNIDPKLFFGYLFYFLYVIKILLLYLILKKKFNNKLVYIFILLSPALIMFSIYDPKVYFLKDIFSKITIIFHAYLILFYNQKKYCSYLKYILLPILGISILIHEYQVLFISIHLLFTIIKLNDYIKLPSIFKIYSFLIFPIFLVLVFIGNQEVYLELNNILDKFNVNVHNQLDGGFYKALGGFYKWHFFYFSYDDFINFFLSFVLSLLIPLIIYGNFLNKKIIVLNGFYRWGHLYFFLPTLILIMDQKLLLFH